MRTFYLRTTIFIGALTFIAAAGGLFIVGLYRDAAALVPVLRGQDAVTLAAVPLLVLAAFRAWQGSVRGALIHVGLLGYILYAYTGAAFAYHFNELFPVYIALFSLTLFTLVGTLINLDAAHVYQQFDQNTPRKPISAFLLFIAVALGVGEIAQLVPFYLTGELPQPMQTIEATTYFVYVLDLGVVVPLSAWAAVRLWQGRAWGYILAAMMLIKAATMGLALLSMNVFAVRAGLATDGLVLLWAAIALGGLGMSFWLLRHCSQLRAPALDTAHV